MNWTDLKTIIETLYPQYVGAGSLIEPTSGSPTNLAILLDLVHNRIANYPYEWPFLKVTSTFTLTGATSYNLATLFPDLRSVYQIYGINTNQDEQYLSNKDGNIFPITNAYTLKDKTLYFTGNAPTSGTATIQYKSKWMVKNAAGSRKKYFEDDDDVTILDDENVLVFGVGTFVNWAADDASQERRKEVKEWFLEAWNNLLLHPEQTNQVNSML